MASAAACIRGALKRGWIQASLMTQYLSLRYRSVKVGQSLGLEWLRSGLKRGLVVVFRQVNPPAENCSCVRTETLWGGRRFVIACRPHAHARMQPFLWR